MAPDQPPLLQVTGEGRVEVTPDTAEVLLGIEVRADQAAAAYEQAAAALSRVVEALLEGSVPRNQLQTDRISLMPIYEKERLVGYQGSSTLRVTLRDLGAVGPVIDRAINAGANTVRGIRFDVRDPGAHQAAALNAAVKEAQAQAAVLAQSLGVRLGPVWRVEADPAPGPVIPAARAVALEAMPVLPGTQTLTRRVRVEFVIHSA